MVLLPRRAPTWCNSGSCTNRQRNTSILFGIRRFHAREYMTKKFSKELWLWNYRSLFVTVCIHARVPSKMLQSTAWCDTPHLWWNWNLVHKTSMPLDIVNIRKSDIGKSDVEKWAKRYTCKLYQVDFVIVYKFFPRESVISTITTYRHADMTSTL